jgi:hypothetical protein
VVVDVERPLRVQVGIDALELECVGNGCHLVNSLFPGVWSRLRSTDEDGLRSTDEDCLRSTDEDGLRSTDEDGLRSTDEDGLRSTDEDGLRSTDEDGLRSTDDDGISRRRLPSAARSGG